MSLRAVTPLLFLAGVALMVPFESVVTRSLGVLALLAFVLCGTVLLAGPRAALLAADEDDAAEG